MGIVSRSSGPILDDPIPGKNSSRSGFDPKPNAAIIRYTQRPAQGILLVRFTALISTTEWVTPTNPEALFEPPLEAASDYLISIAQAQWDGEKELWDIFLAVEMVLVQIFKENIEPAYHMDSAVIGQQ